VEYICLIAVLGTYGMMILAGLLASAGTGPDWLVKDIETEDERDD
jgi:hypothetical protein